MKSFRFKIPCREFSACNKGIWTRERVINSPCKDLVIPKVNLDEYIWRNLDKWPTKIAMVCGITDRSYKYEEIYKQSRTFGANLRKKLKIQNGDTIAVMMRNAPEYSSILLGIMAAGGFASTFNPMYTAHEVERLLQLSNAKIIIADADKVETIKEALKLCRKDIPVVAFDIYEKLPNNAVSFKELVEDTSVDLDILKEVKTSCDDICSLPYSSGTTGLPKGVELTHYNIVSNFEQQNTELKLETDTTADNQDTNLVILPIFHIYGQTIVMLHKLSQGLKNVTLPGFHPETFINALQKYQFNLLYSVPPLVMFLGSHPSVTKKHLEHIKTVVCGAAPLPSADIHRFLEKAPKDTKFGQGYGMTEGCLVSMYQKGDSYETVGYPLPNIKLRVVDEHFNNLPPNTVGELLIKGPNIMRGYRNSPQANNDVFVEDNWYRSGDSARVDENGCITILDRLKELIKVNGYQVPPAELESVLKDHPDILDAAVVGVPDSKSGERPKAFIVLKQNSTTDVCDITRFLSERVAPYKKISDITVLDSIPKSLSGKIMRKELKQQYC